MSEATQHPLSPAFVTLARLLRPQGRRGELLADLLTDSPDLLANPAGVYLVPPAQHAPAAGLERIVVESHWLPTGRNSGRIVVKLPGCDSISDAERLAGLQLMIPAEERPALDSETFYISDLIGCTLFDGDAPVGTVVDVEFAMSPDGRTQLPDAPPLLCVLPADAPAGDAALDTVLVPFARAHLTSVSLDQRRITMQLPPGLFDPADLEAEPEPDSDPYAD